MTELAGRTIRAVDVTADQLGDHADAIADIHQGRLDAVVLRRAFPEPLREAILARLAAGALPWLRPNSSGPQADIHVLGNAATPTFNTPGGPAVDRYFDDAAEYGALYEQLLSRDGHVDAIEELLGRIAGGRPVERLALPDGRRFAGCTIRSLPEGQRIIVHHDGRHFQLPVYQGVTAELDTSTCLSFVVLLQAPAAGGEVVIHGLTDADEVPRLAGGFMPDGEAIKARFKRHTVAMDAGDVLVFSAGRYYHHVAPVIGPTPRITLGGFMTLDRAHRRVVYWN